MAPLRSSRNYFPLSVPVVILIFQEREWAFCCAPTETPSPVQCILYTNTIVIRPRNQLVLVHLPGCRLIRTSVYPPWFKAPVQAMYTQTPTWSLRSQFEPLAAWLTGLTSQQQLQLAAVSGDSGDTLPLVCYFVASSYILHLISTYAQLTDAHFTI